MRVLLSILFILGCFSAAQAQCTADNCKLPDCRCANSSSIPGDLEAKVTPQIVLVTFENALTKELSDLYKRLFASRNPNGCSTRGTFYVQDAFTDYDVVSQLFDTGHEMGVFSVNGTLPVGSTEWMNNIRTVVKRLQDKAGIASDKVHGVRAPELNEGGSDEFIGLSDAKLSYDASCAISRTDQASTALWPYTYDFVPGLKCDIGVSPDLPFKGKWQFLITDLKFGNQTCATPAACTGVKTKKDAFDMFYDTFKKHYNGKRAPIVLAINPQFVETDFKLDGTVQFLEYIRAAYDDGDAFEAPRRIVSPPAHIKYALEANRIKTFENMLPGECVKSSKELARAGFFYLGVTDWTGCFHCDVLLHLWKPQDDVIREHRRWSPHCEFLDHIPAEVVNTDDFQEVQTEDRDIYLKCRVCFAAPAEVAPRSCRHLCLCKSCCRQLRRCPICRNTVLEYLTIYIP